MVDETTIQIKKEVRDALKKERITDRESYNEVLKRLIKREAKI